MVVLERADHADARGAAGYADLLGWGATTDAYHLSAPHPEGVGAAESMRRAVADAGLAPSAIGYLNAHATGTKMGDVAETAAIRAAFPDGPGPAVSSTKAATGHLLGAAGAVEAVATVTALCTGLLPATRNLDDPDPACDLDHIRTTRAARLDAALSNSFAFGGHNVSLVFGKPTRSRSRTVPR